jgi:hypothetical protein
MRSCACREGRSRTSSIPIALFRPSHRDLEQAAVIGDAQRMIGRRRGHDAAAALLGVKLLQRVARAAFLEAAGALQVVELAKNVRAGQLRQPDRLDAGRHVDSARDSLARGFDVG